MSVITDIIETTPTYNLWGEVGGYNRIGDQYKIEISKRFDVRGSPPTVLDVKGYSTSPVSLTTGFSDKSIFANLAGSKVSVQMLADTNRQLIDIARGDDTQYRLVLKEGSDVLFRGYIKPETYRQDYHENQPVVSIQATDGLGLLRSVKFLSELDNYGDAEGLHKVTDIISYLLWKAGNAQNWYDGINYSLVGHTSDNLLRHLEIPVWKYYDETCYDVLIDVLKIADVQLTQINGNFYIRMADKPYGVHYDCYSYKGVYQAVGTPVDPVEPVDMYDAYEGMFGDFRMERPVRIINFEAPQLAVPEYIFNGDFTHKKQGWSTWGDLPDDKWEIDNERHTMKLNSTDDEGGEGGIGTTGEPTSGVQASIYRGQAPAATRIQVTVKAKCFPSQLPGLEIYVGLNSSGLFFKTVTPEWASYTFEFVIPDGSTDVRILLGATTVQNNEPFGILIDEISAVPLHIVTKNQVEDIDNDTEEELFERSQQDITHEIRYGWGGNRYMYENTFPNANIKGVHIIRDRHTPATYINNSLQEGRAVRFYKESKMRLGLTAYKKTTSLAIHHVLYDKFYRRAYVLTQLEYRPAEALYNMELVELERLYIEPDSDWILADGTWDDDGFWRDDAQWHDSDPT